MSTSRPGPEARSREPIPVVLVSAEGQEKEKDKGAPLRFYALLIFFGTLLGTLLGAVADLGEATQTIERFQEILNPPPKLCVVGSDTILGLDLKLSLDWKREFEDRHRVNVDIQAIGSGNGVRRAAEGGCAHVLAMSEPMSRNQQQTLQNANVQVQCAAPVGYDVIAFVTDINNRIPSLQYRDLTRILDGRVENWSALDRRQNRPVTIWARPGSGTTAHILTHFTPPYTGDTTNNFPPTANYAFCYNNEECLNQTLATPGSLYWVGVAWMRTKPPRYLRVLPILAGDERPINPLEDKFTLEEYPSLLVRPLYLYVVVGPDMTPEQAQLARDFLTYARSLNGQSQLEQRGYITYFDAAADVPIELPPAFVPDPSTGRAPVCLG
ncbi:MAG: substrate-binding domain-containing protein [Anaerolineae bacterium]|nr:substrate-binding domain-containing protein [Anaerolineae bacterium]MDW8171597.1 substrate-binding domain-containing protein [Anaerolineae bacterium]